MDNVLSKLGKNPSSFEDWERKKLTASSVTAVIGFICETGIVLASDSQMTTCNETKLQTTKIFRVQFADGKKAIFGIAGVIEGADIFREIFEEEASKTTVSDYRTIANTAASAMKKARTTILESLRHEAASKKDRQQHLENHHCQIILAYEINWSPYIFLVDLKSAIAIRSNRPFDAIGSGAMLASFLLSGFELKSIERGYAFCLGAYVIEACKRADLYCSGLLQIGFVGIGGGSPPNDVAFLLPSLTKKLEAASNDARIKLDGEVNKRIYDEYQRMEKELSPTASPRLYAQSPGVAPSSTPPP